MDAAQVQMDLARLATLIVDNERGGAFYLIERKKNGPVTRLVPWRTEANDSVRSMLRRIVADSLRKLAETPGLELVPWDDSAVVADRPVIEHVQSTRVPNCTALLSELDNHMSLPMVNDLDTIVRRVWAYAVDVSVRDHRYVWFRKYSQGKILRPNKLQALLFRDGRLGSIDDQLLTIDGRVDAIIVDEDVLVLNKPSFELIFDYVEQYLVQATEIIEKLNECNILDDPHKLLELLACDTRKLKRIAAAADYVLSNDMGSDYVERVAEIRQQYGLNFDFDPDLGRILVDRSGTWDIIKLLADDFLSSDLTNQNYEVQSKRRRSAEQENR